MSSEQTEPQRGIRYAHENPTPQAELVEAGRAARGGMPRSAHASYDADAGRDPLGIIERQNAARVADLVPLRMARMLQNPFAFYRGSAAIQAADLATERVTGAHVSICGDAHIANFGVFATPQRTMTFDLNDFDEASYGPWEWDVKRLAASVVLAGRQLGHTRKRARRTAEQAVRSYRVGLREFLRLDVLDRHYLRADARAASGLRPSSQRVIDHTLATAAKRTSDRVARKITTVVDGRLEIVENPPVTSHVAEVTEQTVIDVVQQYTATVSPDIAVLLAKYRIADIARRVVGVGSVGTRCYIAILQGPMDEPLILQVKEATSSVVQEFGGIPAPLPPALTGRAEAAEPGFRVIAGQRVLQSSSDAFLGYVSVNDRSYYVRQFRDRNASFEIDGMTGGTFSDYVNACGTALARAHAQSEAAPFVGGYLGSGTVFDGSVAAWASAYADQARADFEALTEAARDGRFPVAPAP